MKRILSIMLLFISGLVLVACNTEVIVDDNFNKDRIIETNYKNMSAEYEVLDSKVDLHFFKDSVVAYVDVKDYLMMLNGVYQSKEFEFIENYEDNLLTINYVVTYDDIPYEYEMILNAKEDMINVESLDFFESYMEKTETNYSEGLIDLEPVITKGDTVAFDLGEYDFDLVIKDLNFLMPLTIASLIFNQANYFDTYYNGEVIYGIDTSSLDSTQLKTIMESKYNKSIMPEEIKLYNYNYYRFIIDYFYGLKSDRLITTGKAFINKEAFLKGDVSKNIFNIANSFDDLHTSHITRGYYDNRQARQSYDGKSTGENVTGFNNGFDKVLKEAQTYFGIKGGYIDFKDYEYINNNETLVIYLFGFEVDTPKEIEAIIKDAKPTTKNIILDLSLNTGGNLGAVLRMFALTTDEPIWYHFLNPLNNEKVSYGVTGENPAYDQYTYFLKSSSITFSAANLSSSIAKELGIKVIGQKSSGGAAALSFFVFPDGSIIHMSSNTVLTNKEYASIENGIIPDYILKNLYDTNEIKASLVG